jgi:hypothetical protein
MLRHNLVGLIEPMLYSAGADPLALRTATKKPSDDRPPCLENPRPEGAELTLTENAPSPFHAEPRQYQESKRTRLFSSHEAGLAAHRTCKVNSLAQRCHIHSVVLTVGWWGAELGGGLFDKRPKT